MSDLRKAAEMALEDICGAKLCEVNSMSSRAEMLRLMDKAAEALRQALAEPEQEPVAWHEPDAFGNVTTHKKWAMENGWQPLYTAPPQKEWVGLTDEEIDAAVKSCNTLDTYKYFRAIEAKLKEKNR